MGNNDKDYSKYSTGYDPKAVEHDLQRISQLTHGTSYGKNGKKKLTMQQAQEIYYRIKNENIQFQSDIGENFLLSLYENMTDAQRQEIDRAIQRKKQKKQNRKQFVSINRKIACAVSAVVLVSSILCINWSLLMDLRTNYQTKKLQEKIIEIQTQPNNQIFVDSTNSADNIDIDGQDNRPVSDIQDSAFEEYQSSDVILPKFTQLYEENQDFVGWLRIPGTKIDYPVMSRDGDNNYYLDKNFEQQYDKNGLLILDYRNDVRNGQQNLIIYGHNMRTGVMFGTLKNYKEKSFCDEHMIIRFDTLYEECEYKVVAAMLSSVAYEDEDVFRYYDAIDISTEENFNAFKENIMSNAIYTTDETIAYGDTCLILSTCDNYKEDGRFVVIAKKI
ncbi:MAG: class B sortase [Lachnospiraceae bacterium]|nr:class B sortase [Lachnospiraceae bacterium]